MVTSSLGKREKRARVWTIIFPHRVVGIVLQVHRTGFPITTTRATSHDLVKRVAVGRVEIETQHGQSARVPDAQLPSRDGNDRRSFTPPLRDGGPQARWGSSPSPTDPIGQRGTVILDASTRSLRILARMRACKRSLRRPRSAH
jgi:hypothetical protein